MTDSTAGSTAQSAPVLDATLESASTPSESTPSASTPESASASVPPPQVWPTLRATNARALIRFLVEAFGFVEVVGWGEQPDGGGDVVVHAQLSWPPGGGIMLGSARPGKGDDPWPLQPGTFGAYIVCEDPDGLHARAIAAGASPLYGPRDTDYGSREFAVRDPEGNHWSFGTYRGEPRPV